MKKRPRGQPEKVKRNDKIIELLRLLRSYNAVAKEFGVSRQRIRQIAALRNFEFKRTLVKK